MKYTFVCDPDECDALLEFTARDGFDFPSGVVQITCPCGRKMQYVSVESATINSNNKEKENTMENVTIDFLNNQIKILQTTLSNHNNCDHWKAENGRIQSRIIDIIDEIYDNNWTNVQEVAENLCNVIDYQPTKEISFTATMNFTGTISVPASEVEDFDLTSVLEDAYVDINHGDVVIDNYELYDANEC